MAARLINASGEKTMDKILLNCDIGESFGPWNMGNDSEVMPYLDCANIACGFHAADPLTMRKTVALAAKHSITIGAHPAYPDLVGFGRRSMACSSEEIVALMLYQIGALDGICRAHGTRVKYVKPHGALYNDMMSDLRVLRAVFLAVSRYDADLHLMVLASKDNRGALALSAEYGVPVWFEAFADRAYTPSGQLVSRSLPGAVHHDHDTIVRQALTLARGHALIASDGSALQLQADTLCVHGDNPSSMAAVREIYHALGRELAA
jgi:UPF0271 protein